MSLFFLPFYCLKLTKVIYYHKAFKIPKSYEKWAKFVWNHWTESRKGKYYMVCVNEKKALKRILMLFKGWHFAQVSCFFAFFSSVPLCFCKFWKWLRCVLYTARDNFSFHYLWNFGNFSTPAYNSFMDFVTFVYEFYKIRYLLQ